MFCSTTPAAAMMVMMNSAASNSISFSSSLSTTTTTSSFIRSFPILGTKKNNHLLIQPVSSTTTTKAAVSGGVAPAIALTEDALKHLNKMRSEKSEDLCLRIGVKQGGCSGMSYTMEFESKENTRPDDTVMEYNGFVIVCDPKSLLFIFGMQLDFSDALIGGGFSFKNPNATQTCGCGKSFASESSFLSRASSHSLPASSKQKGSSGVRSFIFGRDDSNSRSSITICEDTSDTITSREVQTKKVTNKFISSQSQARSLTQTSKLVTESSSTTSLFEILKQSSMQSNVCKEDHKVELSQSVFAAFKIPKKPARISGRVLDDHIEKVSSDVNGESESVDAGPDETDVSKEPKSRDKSCSPKAVDVEFTPVLRAPVGDNQPTVKRKWDLCC